MMMESSAWINILTACLLLYGSSAKRTQSDLLEGLKLRVNRQVNELKRNLEEIYALQEEVANSADIQLRSLGSNSDWESLISPILTFCHNLSGFTSGVKSTSLSTDDITHYPDKDAVVLSTQSTLPEPHAGNGEWFLPEVRPIRARAERNATKVRIIFDVIHPGPGFVARINSFQFAHVNLTGIADSTSRNFMSRVQFITHVTSCNNGNFDFTETYLFKSGDDESSKTYVEIDTCGFDKYQNMSLEYEDRIWLTRDGIIEKEAEYPKIRFLTPARKRTILRPGRNEVIEFELHLTKRTRFIASAMFYDYDTGEKIYDGCSVDVWNEKKGEPRIVKGGEPRLFLFEIINKTNSVNETDDEDIMRNINLTVRITMLTDSKRWGGKLEIIMTRSSRNDWYDRSVFSSLDIHRVLRFDQPGHHYPPPDMKPTVVEHKNFPCDAEGNDYLPREGINCTLRCDANGPKITGISIRKTDSALIPYRSVSYTLDNYAFAMIDVGPASSKNQGFYQCTVDSDSGRIEKTLVLYSSGFPKMSENASSLVQIGNGTHELSCTAIGAGTLDMSVKIENDKNDRYMRIDNNTDYHRTIQRLDSKTTLKLRIPTNDLKYPMSTLSCMVSSDRGFDMTTFYLYNDIDDYYEFVHPKFDSESTRINIYANGTTAITCAASGESPLKVWIHFEGRYDSYRIDDLPSNLRIEKKTADGKSVTLFVNTSSIKDRSGTLWCVGENEHGRDYFEFDLRNYFD